MQQSFFITGTDTGVGKSWTTVALMQYFKNQGNTVIGMKPIASGCDIVDGMLQNEDALLLQQHASMKVAYTEINCFSFVEPVSPHLAAKNQAVDLQIIQDSFKKLTNKAEVVIVEGVGGWLVPLNNTDDDIETLAKKLSIPVIMIVGIRLGCINHARLTYQAIKASGVECAGWIAMCLDSEMLKLEDNIQTIQNSIEMPLLGVLPFSETADFEYLATKINFN